MNLYFIFLRAVNVSGKHIIKMAELKSVLEDNGYNDVKTYIQSGNVVLFSNKNRDDIKNEITKLILHAFGFQIEVFVLTKQTLEKIVHQNPFQENNVPNKTFITLLDQMPLLQFQEQLLQVNHGDEMYEINGDVLYFYVPDGMAKSKMNNNYFEKKLKVIATGRNVNTMQKMLSMVD